MSVSMENEPAIKKRLLIVKATIAGTLLGILNLILAHVAERWGLDWMEDYGNAILFGLLSGFIFYRLFLQDAVIREVNHHVRNALQVMLYAENPGDTRDALKRIDWTLRKVIRGKFETSHTEEEEEEVGAKDMPRRVVR
ncbi:MAG: hypothetical protein LAP21_03405 [Acidobacteriia bacterium]|nr:hypothetical protein [Terriglobia bacterium]